MEEAKAVFWDRNGKYGNDGLDHGKVTALAGTKLDRIINSGDCGDSALDLLNYALILLLIERGQWNETDEDGPASLEHCLQIKRDERAKEFPLAAAKLEGDAGLDLYCVEDTVIPARSEKPVNVPAGIFVALPKGMWCDIRGRSSSTKRGLVVVSCCIDNGFRGELFSCVHNATNEDIIIKRGERVAQFIIHKINMPTIVEVDELPASERGERGWGSTGK